LAALKALRDAGFAAECFERGSDVGGNWRYDNDSGLSAAYASLRCNVSRKRMQYRAFRMPRSVGQFPGHRDMAAYFAAYADGFDLRDRITFSTTVERLEPEPGGGWQVTLHDGTRRRCRAAVVASGRHWAPRYPDWAAASELSAMHAHDYRVPHPFVGQRVLVVGAGQSAAEIAVELCSVAERVAMSVRSGIHVIPRWILGRPMDELDVFPINATYWPLLNWNFRQLARLSGWREVPQWSTSRRLLENNPTVSSELLPAIARGDIVVKPGVERPAGTSLRFVDGSEEEFDRIIYATGYDVRFPFLDDAVITAAGIELPLYRRIVPPAVPGLYFAGIFDAPGGLLPIVETQGRWIAQVLNENLPLPPADRMWKAINASERRTRQRFPDDSPRSVWCDPHAYRRLLLRDLARAAARRNRGTSRTSRWWRE
jgi:cation diffusion facilitator CzcD-associated flavoprotein CzcO